MRRVGAVQEIISLLSLWICVGLSHEYGLFPRETLSIFALEPACDDGALSCDYFIRGAMLMAAEHLNQQSSILENITSEVISFDRENNYGLIESVRALVVGEFHAVIGPQRLRVSHWFTSVFTNQLELPSLAYNLPEENIVLSGLYYRTLPSNTYIAKALVSLLDYLQMYRVAILSSGSEEYLELFEMFTMAFSNHLREFSGGLVDIDYTDTFTTEDQIEQSVNRLTTSKIKTFIAFTGPHDAVKLICKASKAGLTEAGYVWILPAYTDPLWWRKLQYTSNCTGEELQTALDTALFVASTKHPSFTQEDLTQHPKEFVQELLDTTASSYNLSDISSLLLHSHAVSAYDAVWTIASAWNSVLTQLNCEEEYMNVTDKLISALANISELELKHIWDKEGYSLGISPEESQKYYGQVLFTQLQGGWVCPVALALPGAVSNDIVPVKATETHACPTVNILGEWIRNFSYPSALNCTFDFQWKGDSAPPASGFVLVESEISPAGLSLVVVVSVVFTALSISIAIFNLKHGQNKFVKATSPRLSLGITAASILIQSGVLLGGLAFSARANDFSEDAADRLCWFEIWLPAHGLTLLYGTLLVKNYRLYRIFYNKKLKMRKDDKLSDGTLMLPVLLLLLPVVALALESVFTGSTRHDSTTILLDTDDSSYQFLRISHCEVGPITLTLVFAYFHLLFVLVIILAFLTMRINSRFRQEGKSTAGIMVSVLVGIEFFIGLFGIIDIRNTATGYIIFYYLYCANVITQGLAILGFIYIPPYRNMYKEYKRKALEAAMSVEAALEQLRVEHYTQLQSQAANLRKQLNKIELRIQNLKTKTEDVTMTIPL